MNRADVADAADRTDDGPARIDILAGLARNRTRILKSLAGLALLAFAARTVQRHLILTMSSEAMVISEFVDVAAPIDGIVHRAHAEPGAVLNAGDPLATITNPRSDKTSVNELQATADALTGEIAALHSMIDALRAMGHRFEARGDRYRTRRSAQLAMVVEQSQARLEADRARASAAEARSKRALEMSKLGLGSEQTLEEATRDASVAAKSLLADEHEHQSLLATLDALKDGFTLGDSSSMDKSYSNQRGDEIALRFTQLEGTLREKEARRVALEQQLTSQKAQLALMSESRLTVPTRSRLWSVTGGDGVYVSRGAPLVRLVDCSSTRVLAYLSEWSYNRLRVGDPADVTILPGGARYPGKVDLRLGGPDVRLPVTGALSTSPEQRERYAVVVSSPKLRVALGEHCESGQNAEVVFHPAGR